MNKASSMNTKQHLKDYLTGYLGGSKAESNHNVIVNANDWQQRAQAELDARAYKLITSLDDDILIDLASSQIDMKEVANEVFNCSTSALS